jgi:hypothetical protein
MDTVFPLKTFTNLPNRSSSSADPQCQRTGIKFFNLAHPEKYHGSKWVYIAGYCRFWVDVSAIRRISYGWYICVILLKSVEAVLKEKGPG